MSNGQIENKLLDAIETVVNSAVAKAGYDRTVQATIVRCENEAIGKYTVKYQDSLMYAYNSNLDTSYSNGTSVYVLIPSNDTGSNKQIIGSVKKLGTDYLNLNKQNEYEHIGKNCVNSIEEYGLCSYVPEQTNILYDKISGVNKIGLNITDTELYLKNSDYLICGGNVRTNLNMEQQYAGNFGIVFELIFTDNAIGEDVRRIYLLDIDAMHGNPYQLFAGANQSNIFQIDGENFKYVDKIYIFEKGFPNISNNKPNDIFISNLELYGASLIPNDEESNCSLTVLTPQGIYFDDTYLETDSIKLQAQVKVKGNVVDIKSDALEYYWFKENNSVTYSSDKYSKLGGAGWEYIDNNKTYQYIISKSDVPAKNTKFKCVIVYNTNTVVSREVLIYNYSSPYEITIDSSKGTQFYYDLGETTLTCLINGEEKNTNDYSYVWSVVDNNGAFTSLINSVENYSIDKNKINNLSVNTIVNFSTFKCTAFYKGVNIGVGTIVIKNDLDGGNNYSLIINNGDQVFKYNEKGIAPDNESLDSPITVLPLSFTLYDNTGEEISAAAIKGTDIKWKVPKDNSMITITNGTTPIETEEYFIYNGNDIGFKIDPRYNINKTRNTISLEVAYKDNLFIANTNLSFLKEGELGTNGTDFVCKIVPNIAYGISPEIPMVTIDKSTNSYKLNYIPKSEKKWFKVQLWHDGEKIFESTETGYSEESAEDMVSVSWEILKNKYEKNIVDHSNLIINSTNGEITFDKTDYTKTENAPANIVKCSVVYKGITYYTTIPIIIATIKNSEYAIKLKDNTGFTYSIYTTDGRNPQFDDARPFEIQLFQNDNEISLDNFLSYDWNVLGSIYISNWQSEQNLIAKTKKDILKNQKYYRPIDENNGLCLSNAIKCIVSNTIGEIASIHIPVHLYLNKYGQAAINGWDGNSININEDEGIILAPQVGAGQKESDNSFTGVFMGSVNEAGSKEIETGLFGYNKGERTIELNSKDGSAKFGKEGQGQIILDPSTNKAIIESGNYKDGAGMQINLTDGTLTTGSGKFSVDADGTVHATGFATVKELNDGDIKIPTNAVNGLDSKLAGLEDSIKYLDVFLPTSVIAFTTDISRKPLKTESETITYKATFKGEEVAATAITTSSISNLSVTTSIDEHTKVGTITFGVTKDSALPNSKNIVKFTFSCLVDGITYTIEKDVSVILNMVGSTGRSVLSIIEEYYSSVNSTSLSGGEWSADYPGWVSGRYIWTRSVITYDDGSEPVETSPVCVSGENGRGILNSEIAYQISTSGTDVPTGTWSPTLLTPNAGEFLWTRTIINYTDGKNPSVSYSVSYHGTSGNDGKGISKTEIDYQISASGSDIPTGEWSKTIPTLEEDKYLWTRTTITYTDNTTSVSYSISRSGSSGEDGVGITKVDVEYYLSTSSSAPIGGEWSTTAPTWENGKYMWSRTKVYYTEGQPTISEEVCISGARGTDGTSVSILGSYDSLDDLKREHPTGNPGDAYIIGKLLFIWASNTSQWQNVGQIRGDDGVNGETPYMHIKYSNDGGKTLTGHDGEDPGDYLGQYVDFTKEDSTDVTKYTWKLIKGTDGKNGIGISNVVEYYLASPNKEGITTETAGWGTAIPTMTKDNKYLWNYEEIIYTSGPSKTTTPKVIGMYGEEGKGVSSIVNYYLATNSSSGVTTATSGWTETMQTATKDKKYLWNYEVVNYTDNTNYTSTPAIIGTYAENGISYYTHIRYSANADGTDYVQTPTAATKYIGIATTTSATAPTNKASYTWSKYSGDDGKGVSTTTIEYQVGNSGTTAPTGTWKTSVPTVTPGQYLWTRTTVNYTSGDPSISYSVSYQGIDGDSITIAEKSITYQVSNSGTTEPTGDWSETIPTVGPGKYLWTKNYVKYSDDTENISFSVSYQGANGTSVSISSQKIEYAQGASGTTKPTTGWSETIPSVEDGKYLWTKTTVNYSNGSKTESYSVSYQSKDGTDATQYYTYIKYADDASGTNMTDASDGKKYIGVAISTSKTAPTTATSYTWTKFVGDNATQYYTYIRYSANSTGSGMVETPTSSTKYIGTYVGTSATVPAYTSFKWSKYQGTDGTSPVNIVCGNESQTIPCTSGGAVSAATTITIPFAGYEGSTRKACTVEYSTLPSGITLKSNTAATASADGSLVFSVAKDSTLGGTATGDITLTFTCSSKTFTKTFVWTKANAGSTGGKGDTGVGVKSIQELYYLSSSNSTAPDKPTAHVTSTSTSSGVWTTKCPTWKANYYYWMCSEILYTNDNYGWSNVILNSALNSANSTANTANTNASSAVSTANTASSNASAAVSTADTAKSIADTAKNKIDNLQVGGRNLLRLTSTLGNYNNETPSTYFVIDEDVIFRGNTCGYINGAWRGPYMNLQKIIQRCNLKVGDEITATQWIMFDAVPTKDVGYTWYRALAQNPSIIIKKDNIVAGEWFKINFTITITDYTLTKTNSRIETSYYENSDCTFSQKMYISSPKLEKGSVSTDWTPAPEDVELDISASRYQSIPYYTSTSKPELDGNEEWTNTISVNSNFYIWQKFITVYEDGTQTTETQPQCIFTPTEGIVLVEKLYYLQSQGGPEPSDSVNWVATEYQWNEENKTKTLWVRDRYTYNSLDQEGKQKVELSAPYRDANWESLGWFQNALAKTDLKTENDVVTIDSKGIRIYAKNDKSKGIIIDSKGIGFYMGEELEWQTVWGIDGKFYAQYVGVDKLSANDITSGNLQMLATDGADNGKITFMKGKAKVLDIDAGGLCIYGGINDKTSLKLKTGDVPQIELTINGNKFLYTEENNGGIFHVTKQVIEEYQDYGNKIRIIQLSNGIGFIGI